MRQMNYNSMIKDSVDYIKSHLQEEITAEQIASAAGYSTFHFCRIFTLTTGIPPMDFVRRMRLEEARAQLHSGRRILDIALDFGFDTASGFSKAFRREFGYSPTAYKKRMEGCSAMSLNTEWDRLMSPPKIVTRESFLVAGYGIHTNLEAGFTKDVAAYWDTYSGDNLEEKMYRQLMPPKHGEVGICIPCQREGEKAIYLFGVIVEDFSRVTPDMMTVEVPKGEYAVFLSPPVNNVDTAHTYDKDPLATAVKETWRYIFTQWFPNSPYELDEEKYDFEFYDERCHALETAMMEIYVPIKKKAGG